MTALVRWGCLSNQHHRAVQVSPSLHGTTDAASALGALSAGRSRCLSLTAMHPLGASRGDALSLAAAVESRL